MSIGKGIIDPKGNLARGLNSNRDLTPPFHDWHLLNLLYPKKEKPKISSQKKRTLTIVSSKDFQIIQSNKNLIKSFPNKFIEGLKKKNI